MPATTKNIAAPTKIVFNVAANQAIFNAQNDNNMMGLR